jgi:UDP-N-acetyl-D-galactosamine dehydrogenase
MVNGKSVARLSVATGQSWKDKSTGERKEKTEWHRVVIFNEGLVNVVQQYLKKGANVYIITVPTPVDENNIPDLAILREATRLVGKNLEVGNIVIYESTVYPGVTEDVCVPILGIASDLDFNSEFFVGYSPERINPGDKARKLTDIVKVTSGSSDKASKFVDTLYSSIILAGTYRLFTFQARMNQN